MRAGLAVVVIAWSVASATPAGAISLKKEAQRKRAPDFELQDAQGNTVRLSAYKGKVVLLDFWATWCTPCKASMPWMNELSKKYAGDGLVVVGVSMDAEGWQIVKPFVEKMQIRYPILLGTPRVAYLYGDVDGLPLAFFVDRSQRIAGIHLGAASRRDFEKTIRLLLDAPK